MVSARGLPLLGPILCSLFGPSESSSGKQMLVVDVEGLHMKSWDIVLYVNILVGHSPCNGSWGHTVMSGT